jgi:integrase
VSYLFGFRVAFEQAVIMPTIRLTKSSIDALKPTDKDIVYWDDGLPGFGAKVTPKGRKVFIVLYRTADGPKQLRKYTIGRYGPITLSSARIAAQKILAARLEGRDPAGERRTARERVVTDGVDQVIEEYIARHVSQTRSKKETERILRKEILGPWSGRSIHQIGKRDVLSLLDGIHDRKAPAAANRTFVVVRALFNWCIGRAILEQSPCAGLSKPNLERSRERVLSDEELAAVILAARRIGFPYGSIVELLALTGQRRDEVVGMTWDEVDELKKIWTLCGSRTKNGRPHVVHLSEAALAVLRGIAVREGYILAARADRKFQAFSVLKRQIDEISGVKDWVLHDLRRSVVSGMARLGIAPHIADKILNHQSGTISGVAAVYQRHDFLAERKQAIDLWGDHVARTLILDMKARAA